MGSAASTPNHCENQLEDPWWPIENTNFNLSQPNLGSVMDPSRSTSVNNSSAEIVEEQISDAITPLVQSASESHTCESKESVEVISTKREQSLEEFKEELRVKRMARQGAIADLRNEITNLRQQLESEREINRKLRNGESTTTEVKDAATLTDPVSSIQSTSDLVEKDPTISSSTSLRSQLAEVQLSLQLVNAENLSLSTELGVVRKQVASLKEVIVCTKEMLKVREEQVTQLKDKLREIEDSLAERELKIMSDNLRQEYDRQLTNIRNLRQLYEERARVSAAERENLLRQISIKKDELATETEKTKNLEERVLSLEEELTMSNKSLTSAKIQRDEYNYENKGLKEEMAVINKLFSQMLMGFNGANNLDIDRLTTMLEENRTLLNEMATTEGNSEGACLPKLLFEIVKEANTENEIPEGVEDEDEAAEEHSHVASAQEIIGNLPKVWRVLMELLNHQKIEQVEIQENGQSEDCYKSIQTPTGPKVELSVSKTYIKLKDLILEKKSLQKETTKLKTLNGHLDRRLHEQEKRLSTVSLELTKTWHLVGKMQRQHRQLHTHEQILRYQLQQKRRLLNELKDELEYCRRKWAAARAKNAESQVQCDDLRKEFAKRKLQDANNSAESGYSDGPVSDEDDVEISKKDHNEIFEKSRKIERTHSQSPTRSTLHGLIKRVNSAPHIAAFLTEFVQTTNDISNGIPLQNVAASSVVLEDVMAVATVADPPQEVATITVVNNPGPSTSGAVPKQGVRLSRAKRQERHQERGEAAESLEDMFLRLSGQQSEKNSILQDNAEEKRVDRAARIQRLEKQCKSLITQVIETSSCREELNEQLVRFQEELVPTNKVVENTDVESDVKPTEACLTAREEEYTTRRAERLKRLEDESNALMTRIKKTTDRGKNMTSLIDHIHSRCVNSREGSFDEPESGRNSPRPSCDDNEEMASNVDQAVPKLTETEEAYTARRAERIRRLEEESALLLSTVSRNAERGTSMSTKLDELHSKYGPGTSKNLTNNEDKDPSDQSLELCSGSDSDEKTILQQDHQNQSSGIEDGASNQTLENSLTESAENLDNANLDCESSTEAESARQLQDDSDSNQAHPQ